MQSQPRFSSWLATAAAVLVVGTVGFAASASASPSAAPHQGAGPSVAGPLSTTRPTTATRDQDFAGYLAQPSAGIASMSVRFKIPTVTCQSLTQSFVNFGLQTNTALASIYIYCNESDTATYDYDVITSAGQNLQPATPGDTVLATIFETSTTTRAEIHDLTNGQYWYDVYNGDAKDTMAWYGAFTDTEIYYVPSFPTVTMSDAQLNGDYLGFEGPAQNSDYNSFTNHTVIASGALNTTAVGSAFGLVFKNDI